MTILMTGMPELDEMVALGDVELVELPCQHCQISVIQPRLLPPLPNQLWVYRSAVCDDCVDLEPF